VTRPRRLGPRKGWRWGLPERPLRDQWDERQRRGDLVVVEQASVAGSFALDAAPGRQVTRAPGFPPRRRLESISINDQS